MASRRDELQFQFVEIKGIQFSSIGISPTNKQEAYHLISLSHKR